MAATTNVHEVMYALRQHGEDVERGVSDELDVLAQLIARRMKQLAPKFRSELTNSIHVDKPDAMTREIRPGVAYAGVLEDGIKPGGKGLPRFFDPASHNVQEWLMAAPPKSGTAFDRRATRGSRVFQAAMLSLRDRYEGLAFHIRKFGMQAHPFVEPTAREMEPEVLRRLDLAVRRVLAARPDAGGLA